MFGILIWTTEKLEVISDYLHFVPFDSVGVLPASSLHTPLDEEFFTLSGVLLDDLSETLPADDVMIVSLFDFVSVAILIFSVGSNGESGDFVAVRCFLYFRIRGHISDDGGLI